MYPPVRPGPRMRGSLASAIQTVLSRHDEPAKEMAPHLRGGRDDPIILPMAYSGRPSRLPDRMAERVFENQDATSGDYYNGLRGAMRAAVGVSRGGSVQRSDRTNRESIDGFAHYLGVGEPHGSLEPSPYSPTRARQQGGYMRAPRVWDAMMGVEKLGYAPPGRPEDYEDFGEWSGAHNYVRRRPGLEGQPGPSTVRMLLDATEGGPAVIQGDGIYGKGNAAGGVLANFTLDRGQDERGPYISYYDRYDLDRVPLADRVVGRPFELYDRLYYDPDTLEPDVPPRTPLQAITRRSAGRKRRKS